MKTTKPNTRIAGKYWQLMTPTKDGSEDIMTYYDYDLAMAHYQEKSKSNRIIFLEIHTLIVMEEEKLNIRNELLNL